MRACALCMECYRRPLRHKVYLQVAALQAGSILRMVLVYHRFSFFLPLVTSISTLPEVGRERWVSRVGYDWSGCMLGLNSGRHHCCVQQGSQCKLHAAATQRSSCPTQPKGEPRQYACSQRSVCCGQ